MNFENEQGLKASIKSVGSSFDVNFSQNNIDFIEQSIETSSLNTLGEFSPRSRHWNSLDLLNGLDRNNILLTDEELHKHIDLMEYDMYTEYDAQNFSLYLEDLESKGRSFSPEFKSFAKAWQQDEWNHYIGYRRLYSICTGKSEDILHQEVLNRKADFSPIEVFLKDEFLMCLVMVYDEIFTTRSCQMDYEAFNSFGHPNFLTWIKSVAQDEASHFLNIIDVLRKQHTHRFSEVSNILETLIERDLECKAYTGTFLLDHDGDRFTPELLRDCKKLILRCLKIPES